MDEEFTWDDYEDEPKPEPQRVDPFAKGSVTSENAARMGSRRARKNHARTIYHLLCATKLTTDEVMVRLDLEHHQCSPRMNGLLKAGVIRESGETRLTRCGLPAAVMEVTPGRTFADYLACQRGERKPVQTPTEYRKAVVAAADRYRKDPSPGNLEALRWAALDGAGR